eukprot:748838-Hanusia_phi.AAC.12
MPAAAPHRLQSCLNAGCCSSSPAELPPVLAPPPGWASQYANGPRVGHARAPAPASVGSEPRREVQRRPNCAAVPEIIFTEAALRSVVLARLCLTRLSAAQRLEPSRDPPPGIVIGL